MATYTPATDLPLDTLVLRGGVVFSAPSLSKAFRGHYDKVHMESACTDHFCWALSVNAVPGMNLIQLAQRARRPNGMVRLSTVRRITDAGYSILSTPGRQGIDGHCDVFLPGPRSRLPDFDELIRLEQAFDAPVPNP